MYADFVEADATPHTLRWERKYSGDPEPHGIVQDFSREKTLDGITFEAEKISTANGQEFHYHITDVTGSLVTPEEYLGASGHSVLISPSGDFVHTHPNHGMDHGDTEGIVFMTAPLSDSFYRSFTQFQIDGVVRTVDFDWER